MAESHKYHDLAEELQLRLKRFAYILENSGKNSAKRADKKKAHDIFSTFKLSVAREQAMEAQVLESGRLGVEEGLKQGEESIGEDSIEMTLASTTEGKQLLVFLHKLRFMNTSLIPIINQMVGHLYLVSKDYGVCADQVLYHLEQELGFGKMQFWKS